MRGSDHFELRVFAAVARERSFSRAAARLGLAPSAVSQIIRDLETRVGTALLHRTTRRVDVTAAGAQALARIEPALGELDAVLADLTDLRRAPAGAVRMLVPRLAFLDLVEPRLAELAARYPDIHLDVTVDDAVVGLGEGQFDLGVRLGELLDPTVVAFPMGPSLRQVPVASPAYLAEHGRPKEPADLHHHRCIGWRQHGTIAPYRWEFAKDGREVNVAVRGPLTLNDRSLAVAAAVDGVGITMWSEHRLRPLVEEGKLVFLLRDWCPSFPGFFGYHAKQPRLGPALRAVVDLLRLRKPSRERRSPRHTPASPGPPPRR